MLISTAPVTITSRGLFSCITPLKCDFERPQLSCHGALTKIYFFGQINALAKASRDYLNGPVTAYPFVNNIRSDLEQIESQKTDNGTSGKYPISQRVEKSENF